MCRRKLKLSATEQQALTHHWFSNGGGLQPIMNTAVAYSAKIALHNYGFVSLRRKLILLFR